MKVVLLTTLLLLSGFLCSTAQPAIQWQKSLGGSGDDWANFIQQTTDDGYIIAGYSDSNDGDVTGHHGSTSTYDEWIVKIDSNSAIQWEESLGGVGNEEARSVLQTTDGGYIVAGISDSSSGDVTGNHGNFDYWIVKLNNAGTIEWEECLGGSDDDEAYAIQQTYDGGYIVAGASYSNDSEVTGNHGDYDYWIVKLQSNGNIQWQESLGGSGDDEAYSIQQTTDSGYIIAGASISNDGDVTGNHGGYDYWIVKLTVSGSIQWEKSFGGSSDDYAYSVEQTRDGGYIIAGYSLSNDGDVTGNHGLEDYWIVKLNNAGALQWEQSLGGTSDDEAYSIHQTIDNGYIAAGYTSSTGDEITGNHGLYDYWIVKLDSTGTIQWQECLGGTANDFGSSLTENSDGSYTVAGWSSSNDGEVTGNHGLEDYWIVKLTSQVGIKELQNGENSLSIYPNPAKDRLTVGSWSALDGAGKKAIIEIYNPLGEKVYSTLLTSNFQLPTVIDISSLPPGLYFVEAVLQNEKRVAKFIKE